MDVKKIIASFRGKHGTADEIRAALAEIDTDELEAAAEKIEIERRSVLLDGTDAELTAIEKRIAEANLAAERGFAAKAELERRLEQAIADESQRARIDRYEQAKAKAEAAARLLAKEYPVIAKNFVALLRAVAEADIAVAQANESLPDGAGPLIGPEAQVRVVPGLPEKVVKEENVTRWCHAGTLEVADDEAQRILSQYDNGSGRPQSHRGWQFEKRQCIRRVTLPRVSPERTSPLAETEFPGLRASDMPFWKPAAGGSIAPAAVLARLDQLAELKPRDPEHREQVIQLVPIRDEVTTDGDQ